MKVAVLSLTRDRLAYSQHCFESLRQNAGCEYDHYVLDNGSTDGTQRWLANGKYEGLHLLKQNIGISRGMNYLLDSLYVRYDVIVKFDNDVEVTQPDTLRAVTELTLSSEWILGPVMNGIVTSLLPLGVAQLGGYAVAEKHQIYGCFLAATGKFYETFRYAEANPVWGQDDAEVCSVIRSRGGHCGQVLAYEANHYETSWGQLERFPEYEARKVEEGAL